MALLLCTDSRITNDAFKSGAQIRTLEYGLSCLNGQTVTSGEHTVGDTGCASAGCAWHSLWQRLEQACSQEPPRPVLSAAEILQATYAILNALGVMLTA